MISLKTIHGQTFRNDVRTPLSLLNGISNLGLEEVFPEVIVALKIFLTIPVSVASVKWRKEFLSIKFDKK